MALSDFADGLARRIEAIGAGMSEALFEPVLRLGVTGLARSGKTVFITSLVANLMNRARMPGLRAEAAGRIEAVWLEPQPDVTLPRFDYEGHLAVMTGRAPHWPESTRALSELRLSFRVRPGGVFGGLRGPRTVHLDIVDYPGEWLLDLSLLDLSYAEWSDAALRRAENRQESHVYLVQARDADAAAPLDEVKAKGLAQGWSGYLAAARAAGYSDCSPGRFLLPGDLADSPVLTFAPLPKPSVTARRSLWREMERRFEGYKAHVAKPFFRDHFARIDRQVVLVDVLGAIHAGPRAVEDLRLAMAGTLRAFRPGRTSLLASLLGAKRVERILFAATKADHLHHEAHPRLAAILAALMREAKDRADFAGADTAAMAIASLRTTVEETVRHNGVTLPAVRGRLLETGRQAALYAGELPSDPSRILNPARDWSERWLDADYSVMNFAPASLDLRPGEGPPHIRLDRAAEFLIGDAL